MAGRESVKRLDEDAARALRSGTEESTDGHPEMDPVPEEGFLGKLASVAAMDSPGLLSADGTGCMRGRCGDPEGQGSTIEIGPDKATADGGTKELGEKQARLPSDEEWERTRRGDNLSTFFDHQKCGRSILRAHFQELPRFLWRAWAGVLLDFFRAMPGSSLIDERPRRHPGHKRLSVGQGGQIGTSCEAPSLRLRRRLS